MNIIRKSARVKLCIIQIPRDCAHIELELVALEVQVRSN
jgi:hypothetical protein